MAQWQKLLQLDSAQQDRVIQVYHDKFPREIRHFLSYWIESQNWELAAVDEKEARECFHKLLRHLDEQQIRSVQENNILQGPDFVGIKAYLQNHFEEDPLHLAMIVSECLSEERKILASAAGAQVCVPNNPAMEKTRELDNKVKELRKQTWEMEREIKSLEDLHDKLDFILKTWQSRVEQLNGSADSQALQKEEFFKQANFITQTKQVVLQQIMNSLNLAEQIVSALTAVELPEWKSRQQSACIGSPADTGLDQLEMWFTTVAEVLQQVRQQLKKLQEQNQKNGSNGASNLPTRITEVEKCTCELLEKLLANALVVEKQPCISSLTQRPLILKTGVRFTVKIRFLANLPEFKCLLKVKPVFDKDVDERETVKGFRQFVFTTGNDKVLDVEQAGGGLVAEFGHLSLKDGKSRGKGSSESQLGVTEELHIITFVTKLQQAGLQVDIEASSLPLVVISGTSQISSAWASVMWCNMLSSEPRNLSLFLSPPPVTWQQLAEVLSWQFFSISQRGLDENQLSMLRDKLVDNPDGLIHWSKFCKNDGAWIWIDGILDLIKKHLLNLWRDGSIMGFVSRGTTCRLLKEKQTGTFLLRFSESSKDGAITFSWVEHSNGVSHVHAVEPYAKKDLTATSLPDTLNNYSLTTPGNPPWNPLLYLYPDTPKDSAFQPYYSEQPDVPTPTLASGYVHRKSVSVSPNPTPPSSPPMTCMEMDMDICTGDPDKEFKALWSDVLLDEEGRVFY
ncbi:signal transducer and activator of transcription 1-alpha/beta-like [Centroberyx affinis]|uniref:signal transducer and activator of transcription 1-alpha/beta-like n=1 Tax=Centroberyx affinis TaxID=166261 RepID=UPI003A5BC042